MCRCDHRCGRFIPFALMVEGYAGNYCVAHALELAKGSTSKIFLVVDPKEIRWRGRKQRNFVFDRGEIGIWRIYIPKGMRLKRDPRGRCKIPLTLSLDGRRCLADVVLSRK